MSAPPPPPASPQPTPPAPQGPEAPHHDPHGPPQDGLIKSILKARAATAFAIAVLAIFYLCMQEPRSTFQLLDWGACVKYGVYSPVQVIGYGEWWRFFTGIFVARQGLEILFYLYLFVVLGVPVEKALGTARFCFLYLVAAAGGVAIAELFFPGTRTAGAMVAIYAVLGSLPGFALGVTGSIKKTIDDPGTRSAVFWIGFSVVFGLLMGGRALWDYPATLSASAVGCALGFTLALSKRSKGKGALLTVIPTAIVAVAIGLVASDKVLVDGELAKHPFHTWPGVPSTFDRPTDPGTDPLTNPPDVDNDP
ncbi:rhomboid family intramembrane serine protease, partial [Planctomycetota bacterium]|nr:rhomboid family intramembrane serine protease [Planctomycetota bacterium]